MMVRLCSLSESSELFMVSGAPQIEFTAWCEYDLDPPQVNDHSLSIPSHCSVEQLYTWPQPLADTKSTKLCWAGFEITGPAARHTWVLLHKFLTIPCTIKARDHQSGVQHWKDTPFDTTNEFVIDCQWKVVCETLVSNYIGRRKRSDEVISAIKLSCYKTIVLTLKIGTDIGHDAGRRFHTA